MRKTVGSGGSSSSAVITAKTYPSTVACTSFVPAHDLGKMSKPGLPVLLDNTASGQIKEARLNSMRGVSAVDAVSYAAVEALLDVAAICDMPARSHLPGGPNTSVGTISGDYSDISDGGLMKQIFAKEQAIRVHCFDTSNSVKGVFNGGSLPCYFKVDPACPFVSRVTQCKNKKTKMLGGGPRHWSMRKCDCSFTVWWLS